MSRFAKFLVISLLITLPSLWVLYLFTDKPHANDFYPLYFAAQRVIAGQTPYGPEATMALGQYWDNPDQQYLQTGIAYPLPLILLVAPLTLLTSQVATWLWTAVGFVLTYICVVNLQRTKSSPQSPVFYPSLNLLLPFTFYPFYRGADLHQATLLWCGLGALLLLGMQRKHTLCVTICVVLLTLKPQAGLLLALYGLYWLWKHDKRGFIYYVPILGGTLLGVSLLLQPDWIGAWIQQLAIYRTVVQPPSLLPVGIVAFVVFWRYDLWVKVVLAQVILFPLSDVYSTLPLLLVWSAFPPPLALLGTGISWLWALVPAPTPAYVVWFIIVMPLLLAALWQTRPQALRRAPQHINLTVSH